MNRHLIHINAEITCPFCEGTGQLHKEECLKCGGHKRLREKIPCYIGFGNTLVVDVEWLFDHPTIERVW